ncbi:MAG: TrkH family potassium uptake protein [Ruminococcus sp.]|jgi:trk system potassium uptake protein TrkH|nr:TrkH family potassium uptake protein [Ruminococcus sp.]
MKKNIKKNFTYPRIVAFGFGILILTGAFLLSLPIASRNGEPVGFVNALFTSTSASCVTGLIIADTYTQWTIFGQIVILFLIQIGGLGFLTILAMFSMLFNRRIGLSERNLLQESVNSLYIGGIVRLIKKIILGTIIIELLGAALMSIRLIPKMGVGIGIYNSIFLSISAFCNAGFDLMGRYGQYCSLVGFQDDVIINLTICSLILIGGIGFFVWDDVTRNKFHFKKYCLHTKLVLLSTIAITIISTACFYVLERNNLMKDMPVSTRILASLFSSVTPRTAGFNTIDTAALSPGSKFVSMILMFIGGSPGSTAGGAKTTTIIVLILSVFANLRNENELNIMGKRLENNALKRATSVVTVNSLLIVASILFITTIQPQLPLTDISFEVFSAIDTVGMSTGITRQFCVLSRLILIFLMFCGRIGSLSFALVFTEKKRQTTIKNPIEPINIG